MIILGIETSCDETAASVVENGRLIHSSVVSTQIPFHKPYSGVVPELASRAHVLTINTVIRKVFKIYGNQSFAGKLKNKSIDAIAVTIGPGLSGSLLIGRMTAESLGWIMDVPVMGINHLEGHLLSAFLENPQLKPPFLGLIVSGGHTELVYAPKWNDYFLLGRTRDDAAGEAFDKVAKMMGLGYPGGPVIDRLAKKGRPEKYPFPKPWLPRSWDFSFSGLKTAVLYKLKEKKKWSLTDKMDMCAGFQKSVVDVLVGKTMAAAEVLKVSTVVVGGGVAANSLLRSEFQKRAQKDKKSLLIASPHFCTDNAAMIASAAYFKRKYHRSDSENTLKIQSQLHFPFLNKNISVFQLGQSDSFPPSSANN